MPLPCPTIAFAAVVSKGFYNSSVLGVLVLVLSDYYERQHSRAASRLEVWFRHGCRKSAMDNKSRPATLHIPDVPEYGNGKQAPGSTTE